MFEFLPITNTQKKEMTVWAEAVIEKNKQAMRSGEAYLLWGNRLWYRKEGDAWIDESWWLETAKQWWIRYKDEYSGMGTRVNQALEILVFHFPEEYREYIRRKIDNWYDTEGYHDPGYYWDLIEAVYPDHPRAISF